MELSPAPLSIVERWIEKSQTTASAQSSDFILPVFTKGFEAMASMLNKDASLRDAERAIAHLDVERIIACTYETVQGNDVRSLTYGVFQCLHAILNEWKEERKGRMDAGQMHDEAPNWGGFLPKVPKEEPLDDFTAAGNENYGVDGWGRLNIKEEEMSNFDMENSQMMDGGMAEENAYGIYDHVQPEMPVYNLMEDEIPFEEEEVVESDGAALQNVKVEGRRSSRKRVPTSFAEVSDAEEDFDRKPSVKKLRASSGRKKKTAQVAPAKMRTRSSGRRASQSVDEKDTAIKCIECKFRTKNVRDWMAHLGSVHSTTPTLAGLVIRCGCGYESISTKHVLTCDATNLKVIRTGNGRIRRFEKNGKKATPRCVLCEKYPTTPCGYAQHLYSNHSTSLREEGLYLKCTCGWEVRHVASFPNDHGKTCDGRLFTLHKLSKK